MADFLAAWAIVATSLWILEARASADAKRENIIMKSQIALWRASITEIQKRKKPND